MSTTKINLTSDCSTKQIEKKQNQLLKDTRCEMLVEPNFRGKWPGTSSMKNNRIRFTDTGKARRAGVTEELIKKVLNSASERENRISELSMNIKKGRYNVPVTLLTECLIKTPVLFNRLNSRKA